MVLTSAIYSFVADKMGHLENQTEQIIAAHVVLLHDETKKKQHTVKVHLAVPGPDVHAEDSEDDLYVAIDKVVDKLSRQLRKRKTRMIDQKKHRHRQEVEKAKRGYKR